jgi:hypothetical protein
MIVKQPHTACILLKSILQLANSKMGRTKMQILDAHCKITLNIVCRLLDVPSCIVVALLGLVVDIPLYTVIALIKSPYMLFKGWQRLLHDLISREGPFLETVCVPIAGLAILFWPLVVVGSILLAIVSSIFVGLYGAVIVFQVTTLPVMDYRIRMKGYAI